MSQVDADLDPAALGVPDDPIRLPPGHLACLGCGVAVRLTPAVEVEVADSIWREGEPPPPPGSSRTTGMQMEFARCPACLARLDLAGALLDAHPRIGARIGSRDVAQHRVDSALAGLAVLGHEASVEMSEPVLDSVLRHLAGPGASARWLTVFVPVQTRMARPASASPYPWAHVRATARARLREGYGAVLAEQVAAHAPPVALRPPSPDSPGVPAPAACLMCGVGSVSLPAAQVASLGGRPAAQREVWRPLSTTPDSLGGTASPERVAGHLCPPCADAMRQAGSIGPTAIRYGLTAHLVAAGREDEADRLRDAGDDVTGLVGWGALAFRAVLMGSPAEPPNSEPWQHLNTSLG